MDLMELPTPCYVVDERLIEKNLRILKQVTDRTGAKILLAQKAFSMYKLYPLIGEYLDGAAASGLYEARLGFEEMAEPMAKQGRHLENHVFSPAYRKEDFTEILRYCDHIVFNSWQQVEKFAQRAKSAGKSIGLRINPECSTQQEHAIYDPCAPGSRLGVPAGSFASGSGCISGAAEGPSGASSQQKADFTPDGLSMLDGIHFHTLCEQDSDDLEKTLDAVEEKFGEYLSGMKWINFGGGHHITRPGYDVPRLERCIRRMQEKYDLTVYLEPGEAVALNAGFLVTQVQEIMSWEYGSGSPEESSSQKKSVFPVAILDASAACHMPDVLEMPYRPPLQDSGLPGEKAWTYRLGGPTCLAGDVIGEYSFDRPLQEGRRLVFEDMAIYSMVKNNTFNGMPLPAIALREKSGNCRIVRQFGYEDFKGRLS